jgi:site-specific DNA-methyltransferase (adenine-specific)
VSNPVVIGNATLYLGDCLEILPTLPKVDAVITDPPYGINYSKYESHIDDPAMYPRLMADLQSLAEPLVSDGWMCVFQAAKMAPKWGEWFGDKWRLVALPKTFVQILPGLGPTWATDYALVWPLGKPSQRGKSRDWFIQETSDMSLRPKGHPCPRPLRGMVHLVDALSEQGQMVVDPFMGSGTTGVACMNLGRKFIGIEIEPKYFDIACERIENAQRQQRMFV